MTVKMKSLFFVFIVSLIFLSGCVTKPKDSLVTDSEIIDSIAVKEIKASMENSKDAWNRGDFEGYMDVYWKSDSLVFMGINSITKGWQATLKRYKKGYPDAASRGQLTYEYHNFKPLGKDLIFLIG